MIRLVAFDLDGTLIGDDLEIGPRTRRAIALAQARGVLVTLATGRMFNAALPFAQQLGLTTPLICMQGGWIQAPADAAPRYRAQLSPAVAHAVATLAEAHRWHVALYSQGHIFLHEWRYPTEFYTMLLGEATVVPGSWESLIQQAPVDKILFMAEAEAIPAIQQALQATTNGSAEVWRSHAQFVEVVPRGVDKGSGLAWLAAHLGLKQAEVMAVGDHENDLPMIQWAGLGVAIGNAVPAVQAAARWQAPPLAQEGAAVALERWVLREP